MENLIIQTIGFVAVILALLIYQVRTRRAMLNLRALASFVYGIHFALLAAWTGAAMNFIAVVRSFIFRQRTEQNWADHPFWLWLFLGIAVLFTFITWHGWHSLLPMTGIIIGTIAFWSKEPKTIRWVSVFSPVAWLVYSILVGSVAGIVMETFMLISVITGIVRFDYPKHTPFFAHK